MMLDPEIYATRVIALHGGHDAFFELMNERFRQFNAVWDQDAERIGRVLRAHLAAEHFLGEYLIAANRNLGPIEKARLTFAQKVELLPDNHAGVSFLKPGLRRMNTVRNRIAHRLRVDLNEDDRKVFLGISMFRAMRAESERRQGTRPSDPLSILEQFAVFAAGLLHAESSPERDLWKKAAEPQAAEDS